MAVSSCVAEGPAVAARTTYGRALRPVSSGTLPRWQWVPPNEMRISCRPSIRARANLRSATRSSPPGLSAACAGWTAPRAISETDDLVPA